MYKNKIFMAFLIYCLSFILFRFAGAPLQHWNFLYGLIISQILFLLLPSIITGLVTGKNVRETFSLKFPGIKKLALTGLLAVFAVPAIMFIGQVFLALFPVIESGCAKAGMMINPKFLGISMVTGILIFALVPAICEEIMFRGFILHSLKSSGTGKISIIFGIGLLFGIFHLDLCRLLPVTIIGIIITALVIQTGSVLTGIIYHLVNNSIVVIGAFLYEEYVPAKTAVNSMLGFPNIVFLVFSAIIAVWIFLKIVESPDKKHA